jgi:two-component system, cell cycle response regulator
LSLRFRFLLLSVTGVVVLVIVILWNVDRWATQRFAANAQLFGEIVTQTQLDPDHGLDDPAVARELRRLAEEQARLSARGLQHQIGVLGLLAAALAAVGMFLLAERFVTPVGEVARGAERLADGETSVPMDLERADEIGDLARVFDDMATSATDQLSELGRKSRELQALREDLGELTSTLEKELVVPRLLKTGAARIGAGAAVIWALDPRKGALDVFDYDGQRLVQRSVPVAELGLGSPVDQEQLLARIRREIGEPELDDPGVAAITGGGRQLGLLRVTSDEEVDGPDRQLVEDLARHLGIALENARLYEQAIRDDLTDLYLKRHFLDRLGEEVDRARRYGKPLAVLMADLDHFKRVNDERGHLSGDRVLRDLAALIRDLVRSSDVVGRVGGEEIALILPEQGREGAARAAEKIREAVEGTEFPAADDGPPIRITLSLGVAAFPDVADDVTGLLGAADAALYKAKDGGRNQVQTAG